MCAISLNSLILKLVVLSIFSASYCYPSSGPDSLEPMSIYHDKITLSGFSSGGTFAQMLQFSYSSMFVGIATFSHTYYRCGQPDGNVDSYDNLCTRLSNFTESQLYNPDLVHADIKNYQSNGIIEDTRNLRNKRLYVYAGLRNALFTPRQSLAVVSIYAPYIGSLETIFTRVQDANLVLPTDNRIYGGSCTEVSETNFFIGQCGFSGVTEAINFLLFPHLNSSSEAFKRYSTPRGTVSMFDQTDFTYGLQNHNMDTIGFYYVPKQCQKGYNYNRRCYLHLYFHGCLSGREFANSSHVVNTGLLELADRKGIIMIFPQARSSRPQNEIGCWDTFGISGRLYATQKGPQIIVVKRILDKVLGRGTSRPTTSSSPAYPSKTSGGWGAAANSGSSDKGNGNYGYNTNHHHRYSSYFNSKNSYGRQQW